MKHLYELQGSTCSFIPYTLFAPIVDVVNRNRYEKMNQGGGCCPKRPNGYMDWFCIWEEFSGLSIFNAYYPEKALPGESITAIVITLRMDGWVSQSVQWGHDTPGLAEALAPVAIEAMEYTTATTHP